MFDAKKVKNEIVEWIRNWFEQNGKDCMAVVGISGGKDYMYLQHDHLLSVIPHKA